VLDKRHVKQCNCAVITTFADKTTADLFVKGLKPATITDEMRCTMSIPNRRRLERRPTHPGEMLQEDFLPDYGLTVAGLAEAAGVSRQSINELLRGRRAVSPKMALRLSRLFGNSAEFWLNAQLAVDLWDAAQAIKDEVARIKPLRVA
jgi:antitoxin HigA-1